MGGKVEAKRERARNMTPIESADRHLKEAYDALGKVPIGDEKSRLAEVVRQQVFSALQLLRGENSHQVTQEPLMAQSGPETVDVSWDNRSLVTGASQDGQSDDGIPF